MYQHKFCLRLKMLLIILLIGLSSHSFSQASDYIIIKNSKGRIIKSFWPGQSISFETINKNYFSGPITKIKNDSIFIKTFDIRVYMTNLGVTRSDTFRTYLDGFYYNDILTIKVIENHRVLRGLFDKLLLYGGIGYFLVNLINSAYLKQPVADSKNLRRLGISLAAATTGYLIPKVLPVNNNSKRKDHIEYIRMQ